MKLRTSKRLMNILPRVTAIVLAMLFAAANLNFTNASGPSLTTALQEETGPVHLPLATMGITVGQTARINVVCSPDPTSANPPQPVTVEMSFHDRNNNPILDRSGRPVQKTATIDPHGGDFLDLNGNLVAVLGRRVGIVPSIKVISSSGGELAVPTLELYNNLLKTTFVLSPGAARGFDPQPDPPALPEVAFGLVGITQGVTARLYVHNSENSNSTAPHEPITVEIEFHDASGNVFVDRRGREVRKIVTIQPCIFEFLELNGNDIAAPGSRVGVIPCVKVLGGSPSSLVTPTFEMYVNFTQQTLLLSNFFCPSDPSSTPAPR